MQVYRGMDIGTAKPSIIERDGVAHHMIDIVEPEDELSVAEFRLLGRRIIEEKTVPMVITGGSGLHFRALVDPMNFAPTEPSLRAELESRDLATLRKELTAADSEAHLQVDLANKRRVIRAVEIFHLTGETPTMRAASASAQQIRTYTSEYQFDAIGIDPGDAIEERIHRRLAEMREGGLIQEVVGLRGRLGRTAGAAIGYREILMHLGGATTVTQAFEEIEHKTLKLAKKQRTWFQRDPRIRWIPWIEHPHRLAERALETIT